MICKKCWKVFTENLFSFGNLVLAEDLEYWRLQHSKPASDYFKFEDKISQKRLEDSTIYVAISNELTSENFEFLEKNKTKLFLIGLRNEYKDNIGFSHVEWS